MRHRNSDRLYSAGFGCARHVPLHLLAVLLLWHSAWLAPKQTLGREVTIDDYDYFMTAMFDTDPILGSSFRSHSNLKPVALSLLCLRAGAYGHVARGSRPCMSSTR